ncbi:hypothetical protein GCM10023086_36310 [Streptomyces venetus]|uniref:XRE family transcriptional regulator n=1 Tax=Streptomyces venetus TaxID=1701086 RepID=A0ABP8G0H7_9ACTN
MQIESDINADGRELPLLRLPANRLALRGSGDGIGRGIAYWRAELGYTQSDFGHLIGQMKRWV